MKNCNILIFIVFTTIVFNVSGYVYQSPANDDESDSESPITDSSEENPSEQSISPQLTTTVPPPPPQAPTTLTTVINPSMLNEIGFKAKLIGRSNNYHVKEDKNHQSYILSNVEAYQLPSNDLLIRARIVGNIDWIIRRDSYRPKLVYQQFRDTDRQGHLLNRSKRQADMMTTNQYPPNGGGGGMMMDQNGQPMKPGDPNMKGNPVVERFKQFFGRMREIFSDIRDAFNGNRVYTDMKGVPPPPPPPPPPVKMPQFD